MWIAQTCNHLSLIGTLRKTLLISTSWILMSQLLFEFDHYNIPNDTYLKRPKTRSAETLPICGTDIFHFSPQKQCTASVVARTPLVACLQCAVIYIAKLINT